MYFSGCRRDGPDGGVVTILLFVHCYFYKCHERTIRGDLRIPDPDKIEQVLFSDASLLTQRGGGNEYQGE
jgi:hypothetical protein